MAWVFGIVGIGILVLVSVDMLWTTLLLRSGGPLTSRVAQRLWRGAVKLHQRWPSHDRLGWLGFAIILITLLCWFVLTWIGWTLVFMIEPLAVLEAESKQPADTWSRAYFAGYTLITLGQGDYTPGRDLWQQLTILCSTNGFFLITLAITYLLPLVSTVVAKRSVASSINALGATPQEIVANSWDGQQISGLELPLNALTTQIITLGQQYLAYPVLYCFHSRSRRTAFAPSIAALDEALTLIRCALPEQPHAVRSSLQQTQYAIGVLLETLEAMVISQTEQAPPPAPTTMLLQQAIPVNAPHDWAAALRERRKLLRAFVEHSGWSWQDVVEPPATKDAAYDLP